MTPTKLAERLANDLTAAKAETAKLREQLTTEREQRAALVAKKRAEADELAHGGGLSGPTYDESERARAIDEFCDQLAALDQEGA